MTRFKKVNPKQSFPALEEEMLKFWKENKTFEKSISSREKVNPEALEQSFDFYDGPPFATGTPHYGHILAGTLKDVVPRYQTMAWKKVDRKFGWDCHGLPIENIVEKKLEISGKDDIEEVWVYNFNETCRENVFAYTDEWKKTVDRMWRWVDMENSYKTMDKDFMESVWWVFNELYKKGLIYEGYRVVPYCYRCTTPLSNFEVNQGYKDKQDKTLTVKFKVEWEENTHLLAWTTTPWTLTSNIWLAVWDDIDYSFIEDKKSWETLILASDLIKSYYKNEEDFEVLKEVKWTELIGLKYAPVNKTFSDLNAEGKMPKWMELWENAYSVVSGHHVTTASWTWIVHIAPAYWEDDYQIWKDQKLWFISHIDDSGKILYDALWDGQKVAEYNETAINKYKEDGKVFQLSTCNHSYPHCWRCGNPLIYRAISAWYVKVEDIRDRMVKNNKEINWVPEAIKDGRFGKWVENAKDWNISRNRYWGSAIPVWQNKEKNQEICIWSVKELFEKNRKYKQMTKVIFVRHGRTNYNEAGLLDYEGKAELTKEWRGQAEALAREFREEKIDVIYSSPLKRCKDTITPLAESKGIKVIEKDEFREIYAPDLQDKQSSCKSFKWENGHWWGETIKEVYERVTKGLKEVLEENKWKTIVICSHGDPTVLMRKMLQDFDYDTQKYTCWLYLQNNPKKVWLEGIYWAHYLYSKDNRPVDIHKHFVDEILLSKEENSITNIFWIHGYIWNPEINDFWKKTKENLKNKWINLEAPLFTDQRWCSYTDFTKVLDKYDFRKYDALIAHSMWAKVALEYIIENNIKLKKLLLVTPTTNLLREDWTSRDELKDFMEEFKHDISKAKDLVWEIVVFESTNDKNISSENVAEIVEKLWATHKVFEDRNHYNNEYYTEIEEEFAQISDKKVLAIHGRGSDVNSESWKKRRAWFKENNIEIETPAFNLDKDPTYESWEETFKTLDFKNNKTVLTSSLWGVMTIKYILENDIKLDRLVMWTPWKSNNRKENVDKIHTYLEERDINLENNVKEVIVINSEDDETVNYKEGELLAKRLWWVYIKLNWHWHIMTKEVLDILSEILKTWEPLQRIPEVLDCWFESGSMPYASKHFPFEDNIFLKNEFYGVRHGEAEHNVKWIWCWEIENAKKYWLTEKWIQETHIEAKKLKEEGIEFDYIITSPLRRTLETANIFKEYVWWEVIEDAIFKETTFGEWEDKEYLNQEIGYYFTEVEWMETRRDVLERVREWIKKYNDKFEGKKVLIVSHKSWIRALIRYVNKVDKQDVNSSIPYKLETKHRFPAEFIAEGLDQTRWWFYTLLILWTALFDKSPFQNVIVNWIVLAEDGQKMSKSKQNYPDPNIVFDKYWADAMRFYLMNSPVVEAQDFRFAENWVEEVVKKVMLPLWNTYYFFTTYANIDNFEPKEDKNIYFLRHWETENNVAWLMNWWDVESPLTKKWIEKAREEWRKIALSWVKFDKIIYSGRERALHTAQLIAKEIGFTWEIEKNEAFNEQLSWNFAWKSHSQIAKEYNLDVNDKYALRKIFKDKAYNWVEWADEFVSRVQAWYKEVKEKYAGQNVLIVAHAGTYRPINAIIENIDLDTAMNKVPTVPNCKLVKFPNYTRENNLDKWIISELHSLISVVENWFENYKLQEATRKIVEFMDNLTNWYIRRSRKRFWKSENDGDKMQAYNTLYEVLVQTSKVIAPFMPMLAEKIYKDLTNKESVHLDVFPNSIKTYINEELNISTDRVQKIINLWLSLRTREKIRVRQPMKSITIWENLSDYFVEIIKEELNVKEVIIVDPNSLAKKICKPNGRAIGPKFGKDVKFIMWEAKSWNFEEIWDGKVKVWEFVLEEWEYEMAFETSWDNLNIESGFGMVIAMDTELDEDLINEWIARDAVRFIQEARKTAEYNVDDRIEISISWDILEKIWDFREYIETETLWKIVDGLDNSDLSQEVELWEESYTLQIKKAL